jgi:hypothetical protein
MPNADINPVRQGTDNDDDMVVHTQQRHKERRLLAVAAGGLSQVGQQSSPYQSTCIYSMMSFRHYNTPEELSSNHWQSVLRLSKIFRLDDVRQNAAKNLKDIFFAGDLFEALLCAKENNLDDWIEPLVKKFGSQRRDLSEEELENFGTKIATKVAWAQGAASSHRSSSWGSQSLFGAPLKAGMLGLGISGL